MFFENLIYLIDSIFLRSKNTVKQSRKGTFTYYSFGQKQERGSINDFHPCFNRPYSFQEVLMIGFYALFKVLYLRMEVCREESLKTSYVYRRYELILELVEVTKEGKFDSNNRNFYRLPYQIIINNDNNYYANFMTNFLKFRSNFIDKYGDKYLSCFRFI